MLYTYDQIKDILEPVFKRYSVRSAFLFGSYAKGLQTERSDIDIIVDSGLRGIEFFGLLEDVIDALGKDVDLLDVSQIKQGSKIQEETKRTGLRIYG